MWSSYPSVYMCGQYADREFSSFAQQHMSSSLRLWPVPPAQLTRHIVTSRHDVQASSKYWPCYRGCFRAIMQQKLGLMISEGDADDELIAGLLHCMQKSGVDMHVTFRSLSLVPMPSSPQAEGSQPGQEVFLNTVLATAATPEAMAARVRSRMDPRQLQMLQQLASASPMAVMSLGISAEVCPYVAVPPGQHILPAAWLHVCVVAGCFPSTLVADCLVSVSVPKL